MKMQLHSSYNEDNGDNDYSYEQPQQTEQPRQTTTTKKAEQPSKSSGNKAVIKSKPDIYGLRYYVMCGKCETKTHIFEKCVDAVELWNKRISDN